MGIAINVFAVDSLNASSCFSPFFNLLLFLGISINFVDAVATVYTQHVIKPNPNMRFSDTK